MPAVKVFISYSWSSAEHEEWVLRLATELREAGIDAILDKWDLKEGQEANAFMEKMVSDPEIAKVVIISDRAYVEKSNSRKGGAGTEAQIISKEIFSKQEQTKFVVAATQVDDEGRHYIPAYYTSRIFIDFSDESKFASSFEQLLRWIADKPIHRRPELGSLPKYISDPEGVTTLATSAAKRRVMDGLTNAKPFSYPATKEYFEIFIREIEKFRFPSEYDPLSDDFVDNFQSFMPYRDEVLEVIRAIANYTEEEKYGELIHAFFEKFQTYFRTPKGLDSWTDFDFDNFKFFAHELFLHTGALLISEGRYELFNLLVERPYYLKDASDRGLEPLNSFTEFRHHLKSLAYRNEKLELRRMSLAADMIRDRTGSSGTDFSDLMQVDFILFLRAELSGLRDYDRWWPETLVFVNQHRRAFEIFDRSRSKRFFEQIRPVLGNATEDDLYNLVDRFSNDPRSLPYWERLKISPARLIGVQGLCSLP